MLTNKIIWNGMEFQPDTSSGFSETMLKLIWIKDKEKFKEFKKWMAGQTCAVHETTKEPIYYTHDVQRFLDNT